MAIKVLDTDQNEHLLPEAKEVDERIVLRLSDALVDVPTYDENNDLHTRKDLTVEGDFVVRGHTTIVDVETVEAKSMYLVTNSEGSQLLNYTGVIALTGQAGQQEGDRKAIAAPLYDVSSDTLKIGLGTYTDDGVFIFDANQAQSIATRSDDLATSDIPRWNGTAFTFERSIIQASARQSSVFENGAATGGAFIEGNLSLGNFRGWNYNGIRIEVFPSGGSIAFRNGTGLPFTSISGESSGISFRKNIGIQDGQAIRFNLPFDKVGYGTQDLLVGSMMIQVLSSAPTTSTTANFVGQFGIDATHDKTYQCTAIATSNGTTTYTWTEMIRQTGSSSVVIQSTYNRTTYSDDGIVGSVLSGSTAGTAKIDLGYQRSIRLIPDYGNNYSQYYFRPRNSYGHDFTFQYQGSNYEYDFPLASGTIALTSNIPTSLSDLSGDSTHRTVTDTDIAAWNAKLDKTSSSSRIYGTDSTGAQALYVLGSSSGDIARYGGSNTGSVSSGGYLLTNTPVNAYQAANKTYVDTALDGKVDKTTTAYRVYGTNVNGAQTSYNLAYTPISADAIVLTSSNGRVHVGTPTADNDATTKLYVDSNLPTIQDWTV